VKISNKPSTTKRTLPLKRSRQSVSSSEANSQQDEAIIRGNVDNEGGFRRNEDPENQESGSNDDDYEDAPKIPNGLRYNSKKKLYCIC
jgi:hypothetical protein